MNTLYLTYWLGNKAATEQQRLDASSPSGRNCAPSPSGQAGLRRRRDAAARPADQAAAWTPTSRSVQNRLEAEELKLLNDTPDPTGSSGCVLASSFPP
jgi:hypothetical protein